MLKTVKLLVQFIIYIRITHQIHRNESFKHFVEVLIALAYKLRGWELLAYYFTTAIQIQYIDTRRMSYIFWRNNLKQKADPFLINIFPSWRMKLNINRFYFAPAKANSTMSYGNNRKARIGNKFYAKLIDKTLKWPSKITLLFFKPCWYDDVNMQMDGLIGWFSD